MSEAKTKDLIRRSLLQWRICVTPARKMQSSQEIRKKLRQLSIFNTARHVLCYLSVFNEIETLRIIDMLLQRNASVCVPVYNAATKQYVLGKFRRWSEVIFKETYAPTLSRLEPIDPHSIELAICPGVAFDKSGNRLGFGKGYFDRLLATLSPGCVKVGLCYHEQLISAIPSEPHDVPMNVIITEKRVVIPAKNAKN